MRGAGIGIQIQSFFSVLQCAPLQLGRCHRSCGPAQFINQGARVEERELAISRGKARIDLDGAFELAQSIESSVGVLMVERQ